MASILKKAKNYKQIPYKLSGNQAHILDPFTPPPQILRPTKTKKQPSPEDVSDFPRQQTIPIPEAIPYMEGKYRPASVPVNNGYYPYNSYLEKGKVYLFCTCGASAKNPWCDSYCNKMTTRLRPIYFNVTESGYYKMCNCKQSSNSPFCNGTHRAVYKFQIQSHRGAVEFWGFVAYCTTWSYLLWNYFT